MDEHARSAQASQRHPRGLLQTIDEQPEADARRMRALLAEHGLAAVEHGTETWLPVELLVTWVEATEKAYDRARAKALFHPFAFVEEPHRSCAPSSAAHFGCSAMAGVL